MYRHDTDALSVMDWFCGAGGSSQGVHAVPGVRVERAANHWELAIDTHERNFPTASHYRGDIREAPVWDWPVTDIFWASPECTNWSIAKGKQRDYDVTMQGSLEDLLKALAVEQVQHQEEDEQERAEKEKQEKESRALMEEVPLYLRGVQSRGGLVKAGVVENVTDVRKWDQWDRWIGELHKMGYRTRVIALNSMHANPRTLEAVPQSRDRLYVGYWHESLGRSPDWDKWLRPRAYCPGCDEIVLATQVWLKPGRDMGRYRDQYEYRCPRTSCRNTVVEPEVLPAAAAIDWSMPGKRIGDRPKTVDKPEGLAPKTMARIRAGLERFGRVVDADTLAVPPLLIPVEGRDNKAPGTVNTPLRTQTTRNETGLAWLPFIAELRGGGSTARSVTEALATVTASGNHHGLVTPPNMDEHLLMPYYGKGVARPVREPVGTMMTRDKYALVRGDVNIDDVLFRMLEPREIGRAMSFANDYVVLGNRRQQVKQYGNAVTPPVAEVIVCALMEAVTGEEIDRYAEPEFAAAA
jgi:DNA (cytosine-5)-methyltransferase 1